MKAFLKFEYMITPGIIKILSYIAIVVTFIMGVLAAISTDVLGGLALAVGGPIVARIYAELMLVIFDIRAELKKSNGG
jgi:hypothetical protein